MTNKKSNKANETEEASPSGLKKMLTAEFTWKDKVKVLTYIIKLLVKEFQFGKLELFILQVQF